MQRGYRGYILTNEEYKRVGERAETGQWRLALDDKFRGSLEDCQRYVDRLIELNNALYAAIEHKHTLERQLVEAEAAIQEASEAYTTHIREFHGVTS